MRENQSQNSFRPLGRQLKTLRVKAQETLVNTSDAVEIDVKQLAAYELGQTRPSEDILLLLISHFNVRENEAIRLWQLAGYGLGGVAVQVIEANQPQQEKPGEPVLFTDTVDIIANNHGVVMNFMQTTGKGLQPTTVAKVGMSREHAKSILKILQITLARTEQQLPGIPKRIITPDTHKPEA
jgi:transcriptional regulator with XRE-family HTH domain